MSHTEVVHKIERSKKLRDHFNRIHEAAKRAGSPSRLLVKYEYYMNQAAKELSYWAAKESRMNCRRAW